MNKIEKLRIELGQVKDSIDKYAVDIADEAKEITAEDVTSYKALQEKEKELLGKIDMLETLSGREAEKENFSQGITVEDNIKNIKLGAYLQECAKVTRGNYSSNLVDKYTKKIKHNFAIAGGSENVPSDGGFLVGEDLMGGIISNIYDNSQVLSRCTRRTLSTGSNTLKMNGIDESSRVDGSRYGGIRGYWTAEGDDLTASAPKFRQIELVLNKLAANYTATDEVLMDASVLEQEVIAGFTGEMAFKIQDAIIRGNGAGKPQGILSSPALISVGKETGQTADTINYTNIVNMYSRFNGSNGIWIANRETFKQLAFMEIEVGTGGTAAYLPANGAAGVPYSTLMGLPLIFVEQASGLGDEGDIMLVDMSKYIVAEKSGIQMASSIHVYFTTDQTIMRWITRLDGQSLVNSPLTPYKGSDTVSPFITLAERA